MLRCVLLFLVLIFVLFPHAAQAQVVINEFSSNTSDDWVEIFSSEDVDIFGWAVWNSSSEIGGPVPDGKTVGPSEGKYYVFDVGNRLNKDGDLVKLVNGDGTMIDEVEYNNSGAICLPSNTGSLGRYPDGNSTIERFSNHTRGVSNDSVDLDPCPTPTKAPTKTPTPTPTLFKVNLENASSNGGDVDIDDLRDKLDGEVLGSESEGDGKFPIAVFLLVGSGICFASASGYLIQKKRREEKDGVKLKE